MAETTGKSPADIYESVFVPAIFAPLTRETLDRAALRAGERVLDLACGTGVVARMAALLLGSEGRITAIDLRPGMIAKARSLPPPAGAPIDWREGDATALDLPDAAFDAVLCQQGLQFFPDRIGAVREMRRILVPGGRVVLAVWRGLDHLTLFKDLTEAEARHLEKLGVSYEDVATPFLMGDADEIRAVLADGGLADVALSVVTVTVRFPSAATFVEDVETGYASVMPQFVENPAAFRAFVDAVAQDIRPALDRHRDGDGVTFTLKAHMATGRR